MLRNGRQVDPQFLPDEVLFRRVPTRIWDIGGNALPGIEAIELPDVSVGRSKYGHAEWVRFDPENNRYFEKWGVIGFQVSTIPTSVMDGDTQYKFACSHEPYDKDFPHSEIRTFCDGSHIANKESIPEAIDLEWRELLRREIIAFLLPRQKCEIRQQAPESHIPDPIIPK